VLIQAAPLAITRVLRNVLTNAATHGKSCKVFVQARQDFAVVVVEDIGPGIPAEVIDRVFEPFFRIDQARQQPVPGAGLGLAIAKEIVGRHGGEIFLNNRPSQGLRQEIKFPRYLEQQSQVVGQTFGDAAYSRRTTRSSHDARRPHRDHEQGGGCVRR
jgi:signal transduction histidine kinase